MRRNDVFPSRHLKAEDIKGREVTVTISHVEQEELIDNKTGKRAMKPVIYFKGKDKGVVVNVGNWDILENAYGDSDDWPDKRITLYTEPTRRPDGTRTDGIRVKLPPGSQAAPPRPARAPPVSEPTTVDEDMSDEIPF
jgi:hypothetical protein